jgi:dUTP pyrophosphatase
MDTLSVRYQLLDPRAVTPAFATPGSAAFDLAVIEPVTVPGRETVMARTGLVIQAPTDHMLMVAPRSSTWKRWGVRLANTVGIVDSDYCGPEDEIYLALWRPYHCVDLRPCEIPAGTRIAQGLFVPVTPVVFEEVSLVGVATRGGWGSTG